MNFPYAARITSKLLAQNYPALAIIRWHSGICAWKENLTTDVKHRIEEYWKDKLWSPPFDPKDNIKEKFYCLSMFPYPSGQLHMGHVRVYTISDTVARFHRMNGKNVFHPIGWDAFGLPAENAAIERSVAPDKWTKLNIEHMKEQLQKLRCSFDWASELATCDPSYYKWTQYLFLKMYEEGLVYRREALVNWDPVDKTVLADEQVDEYGRSWRSGARVERKALKQWFIRTTRFAKQLYEGLDDPVLEDWRDITKVQKHWIGECNGVSFDFKINGDVFTFWTSRPELITNVEFIALKSSHMLSKKYDFTKGTYCLPVDAENPFTGKLIPIFTTDLLEYEHGVDSRLGIPLAFETDCQFCDRFGIFFEEVPLLPPEEVPGKQHQICESAKDLGIGGYWTSAKLRDWLISRQRYWGTPIPIIHCDSCGPQPVPFKDLPVVLPPADGDERVPSLSEKTDWLNTHCPNCGGPAKRETDTMDTFVDSAWYYLRYLDPKNDDEAFDVEKAARLMPVDLYIGGKEHAALHLYYARFFNHFLHSLELVPEREPFCRLLVQGVVMGRSYRIKESGQYVPESQVKNINFKKGKAVHIDTDQPVDISWEKMSKSKHNGVEPDEMFKQYGVDTTRLLILADVAPTSTRNWNSSTFPGILNWQHRLWLTLRTFLHYRQNVPKEISNDLFEEQEYYLFDSRNYYIKGTTFNYYTSQQMSVAVSKMQGMTNSLRKTASAVIARGLQYERALSSLIIMLAPIAPHFASELWAGFVSAPNRLNSSNEIRWDKGVLEQRWPDVDLDYNLDLIFQINGQDKSSIKMQRQELESLNYTDAVDIALREQIIKEEMSNKDVKDIKFDIYPAYQGVVNILTKQRTSASTNTT